MPYGKMLQYHQTVADTKYVPCSIYSSLSWLWIGYEEPNTAWNDGSPFWWSRYKNTQPNGANELCTFMSVSDDNYQWFDHTCSSSLQGLCQISGMYF